MKKGLILEGGAMRGMFTAGIIDVMMESDAQPVARSRAQKVRAV